MIDIEERIVKSETSFSRRKTYCMFCDKDFSYYYRGHFYKKKHMNEKAQMIHYMKKAKEDGDLNPNYDYFIKEEHILF